jgi:hypothetical protein
MNGLTPWITQAGTDHCTSLRLEYPSLQIHFFLDFRDQICTVSDKLYILCQLMTNIWKYLYVL